MRKTFFSLVALLILVSSANIVTNAAEILPASSTPVPASEPDPSAIKAALEEFKSLSKKEKKDRFKQIKKEIKAYKAAKKRGEEVSTNTLLLVILALLVPPLAVYLHEGEANAKFWISLLLCLLAFVTLFLWAIPVIYAILVVLGVF